VCIPLVGVGEGQDEEGHEENSEYELGDDLGDQAGDEARDNLADGVTEFCGRERFHCSLVKSKAHEGGEEAMEPAVEEQRAAKSGSEGEYLASTSGLSSVDQTQINVVLEEVLDAHVPVQDDG